MTQKLADRRVQSAKNRSSQRGLYWLDTTPFATIDFWQLSIPPIGQLLSHLGYRMKIPRLFLSTLLFSTAIFAQPRALNQFVYEIRNPQTDPADFRHALEKIGENLAYDILEELEAEEVFIQTLTGEKACHYLLDENPVLVTILRAGLPLNSGVQKVFPNAEVGFLAMSRNEETLKAKLEYVALPDMKDKTVIISDTMLATGGSLLDAIKILEQRGAKKIFVITAIASKPGIERLTKHNSAIKIYAAAIDPYLNKEGFIIPGLGDAGDRSYGKKQL